MPLFLLPGWWCWPGLVLFGLWLAFSLRYNGLIDQRTPLDWPVALFLPVLALGLIFSIDPALSVNRAWSLVGGLIAYVVASKSFRTPFIRVYGGHLLTGLALAVSLLGLVAADWGRGDLLKLPFIYDHLPHLLNGSFGSGASAESEINPRVVAGALAMLVPVVWANFFTFCRSKVRSQKFLKTVLLLLGCLFVSFTLLLTQAPTAIGGLLLTILLILPVVFSGRFVKNVLKRRLVAVGLVGLEVVLVGGLIGLLLPRLLAWLPAADAEPTRRIVFRLEMWQRALDMFSDKPFTGIGLNNFPTSLFNFYPTYSLGPEAHAHNLFLQTALDGGFLGIGVFVCVLTGVCSVLYRAWIASLPALTKTGTAEFEGSDIRGLVVGVAIGTLAWLFYGIGEAITLAHKPAVILWLMWGMIAALSTLSSSRRIAIRPDANWLNPNLNPTGNRHLLAWSHTGWLQRKKYSLLGLAFMVVCLIGWFVAGDGLNRLKLNLAIVEGQKAILSYNASSEAVIQNLQAAINQTGYGANRPATLDLAAHLMSRQGQFAAATGYLQREVQLDSQETIAKYIPARRDWWRPLPDLAERMDDPVRLLYTHWKLRYPTDVLSYARLGIALRQQCQFDQAGEVLREGIKQLKPADGLLLKMLLEQNAVPGGC